MKLIAFIGGKGSGKTLASSYISDRYCIPMEALATPMKEAAKIIFQWDDRWVYGDWKETIDMNYQISPRQFLQQFGTEFMQYQLPKNNKIFGKSIGREFWCWRFVLEHGAKPNMILQDMRFVHEAKFFKKNYQDCIIIKINRDTGSKDKHSSEREYLKIKPDYTIDNKGTPMQLFDRLDALMTDLGYDCPSDLHLQEHIRRH